MAGTGGWKTTGWCDINGRKQIGLQACLPLSDRWPRIRGRFSQFSSSFKRDKSHANALRGNSDWTPSSSVPIDAVLRSNRMTDGSPGASRDRPWTRLNTVNILRAKSDSLPSSLRSANKSHRNFSVTLHAQRCGCSRVNRTRNCRTPEGNNFR